MTDKYQGWANYETWCVNLWLTNEEGSYNEFRDLATEFEEDQIYEFGKEIRAHVEQEIDAMIQNSQGFDPYKGMVSDMIHANLSSVDWEEIAKGFKED